MNMNRDMVTKMFKKKNDIEEGGEKSECTGEEEEKDHDVVERSG